MMTNILDIFEERGFVEQTTHAEELHQYLGMERVTCYIGFDPTASSLHVGSLVPIMALAHMQRNGHRPIALVGGGTGLVGDPSGKTEMRQMLTRQEVNDNAQAIKAQLSRFIDFSGDKALMLNNADWLEKLHYISLLRDIGRHFSVNRMIKAESYKKRLDSEDGLSFIEFNYMVLQSYDFLRLYEDHGCKLQMGGSDQWGNIVAGIELIRRKNIGSAYGITFPLITTSSGSKMGKTEKGAIWLDAERTSAYEYFQFWVNTDDRDVTRFLKLFTFLPVKEIEDIAGLAGADLNSAKKVLAFEATRLAHGMESATESYNAATRIFGGANLSNQLLPSSSIPRELALDERGDIPTHKLTPEDLENGIPAFKLFHIASLCKGSSEARRLIEQGGAYVNGSRLSSMETRITMSDFKNNEILLRAGKKRYFRFVLSNVLQ
jgi:tyrosyl-tRNA synthetase